MDDLDRLSPHGRFLHHCAQGELAFQRTPSGRALFHPRVTAPAPDAGTLVWAISGGTGSVHSVTLVHHRNEAPFALALIDLDDGFRMMSRVDADDPGAVAIGARVRVGFRSLAPDQPVLPVFTLMDDTP